MSYSETDFRNDAAKTARTLHMAFRRCEYLLDRWYAGMNTAIPNEGDDAELHLLMNRVSELVSDYEANDNAKLNTVMAQSDLVLPGDN